MSNWYRGYDDYSYLSNIYHVTWVIVLYFTYFGINESDAAIYKQGEWRIQFYYFKIIQSSCDKYAIIVSQISGCKRFCVLFLQLLIL